GLPARHLIDVEVRAQFTAPHLEARERRRVDDLVDVVPQLGPAERGARQLAAVDLIPVEHRLVVTPPVEVPTRGPEELVDEAVHLLIGGAPVEVAAGILAVAVERDGGEVDERRAHQAGHTPMMMAMITSVTSSWAQFSTVSPAGRRSNWSWVMKRAAVKPAHRITAVSTAFQKKLPP